MIKKILEIDVLDLEKNITKEEWDLISYYIHGKLKIIENNIGMGNVCLVPLNYLFRRGQGIKIFSLIAKQCMERNSLIPTIKYFNDNWFISNHRNSFTTH